MGFGEQGHAGHPLLGAKVMKPKVQQSDAGRRHCRTDRLFDAAWIVQAATSVEIRDDMEA